MVRARLALGVLGLLVACGDAPAQPQRVGDFALSEPEAAERFLELLGAMPGTTLQEDEPCPMENPVGDSFFHVLQSEFPAHVFADSVLEFQLLTTSGLGPDEVAGVVACVDGASGFVTIEDTTVEEPDAGGMPMMSCPLLVGALGSTGSDDGLVGGSIAVSTGVVNSAGQVGTYSTTVAQVCAEDGTGCEQPCATPVVPTSSQVFDNGDGAVCSEASILDEDGVFATLGRTSPAVTTVDGVVPVSQACVAVNFPATMTNTVRVVGSWVRDAACGGAACSGEDCGTGHAYGVWVSDDGGATLTHVGMAQGGETTTAVVPDPQAPSPPLAAEHFLAGATVDTVVLCRLGFDASADQVALDYVELCPV